MKVVKLSELEVYILARKISLLCWNIYSHSGNDIKYTVGSQIVRSADSIGANIAEGFGRYHYMDSVKFYYYARGSLLETLHWFELLAERHIIDTSQEHEIKEIVDQLNFKLNNFINYIKTKNNHK